MLRIYYYCSTYFLFLPYLGRDHHYGDASTYCVRFIFFAFLIQKGLRTFRMPFWLMPEDFVLYPNKMRNVGRVDSHRNLGKNKADAFPRVIEGER